jgi:hypothetical protein
VLIVEVDFLVQCGQIVVMLLQMGLEVLVVHISALVVVTVTVCVEFSVIVWVSHIVEGGAHDCWYLRVSTPSKSD